MLTLRVCVRVCVFACESGVASGECGCGGGGAGLDGGGERNTDHGAEGVFEAGDGRCVCVCVYL
jgi:hypothetical protein